MSFDRTDKRKIEWKLSRVGWGKEEPGDTERDEERNGQEKRPGGARDSNRAEVE